MTRGVGVVLGEPRDVVFECVQTRGGDDARLPHPATETFAPAADRVDGGRVTGDHGSHRSAETLADADRDRVALVHQLGGRDAQGDRGVEQPRAVAVHPEPAVVGRSRCRMHPRRVDGGTTSAVVGVLDAQERGDRLMDVRHREPPT